MKPDIGPLKPELRRALAAVASSGAKGRFEYKPVALELENGEKVICAYAAPLEQYRIWWGEDWTGRSYIPVGKVKKISESPLRLPPEHANALYEAGESSMGGCTFTLRFSDGTSCAFDTGNAVDFLDYPPGKSPKDVVAAIPHEGRGDCANRRGLDYHWVLYEGTPGLKVE